MISYKIEEFVNKILLRCEQQHVKCRVFEKCLKSPGGNTKHFRNPIVPELGGCWMLCGCGNLGAAYNYLNPKGPQENPKKFQKFFKIPYS